MDFRYFKGIIKYEVVLLKKQIDCVYVIYGHTTYFKIEYLYTENDIVALRCFAHLPIRSLKVISNLSF